MKRCMYCGHENDDSVVTCAVCGNRLSDIPDGQTSRKIGFTEDFSEEDVAAGQQADSFESTQKPEEPAAETREAFAGQRPVDDQFSGETPAGQFPEEENAGSEESFEEMNYAQQADPEEAFAGQPEGTVSGQMQGGQQYYDGTDWRQDVGRGQTYAARQQYEAKAGNQRERAPREQYGDAGYGYRQPQGGQVPPRDRADYGKREQSAGGSKAFMIKARKRVKSLTFFLMALFFTAMLGLNAYNIISGNAMYNLSQADSMLANILGGNNTFFTQILTELCSQLVSMIVNVYGIAKQLGDNVMLGILLVFLIPNALYCLALWLMFGQTDIRRRQFSMGGYTLARVMWVLKFIIACIVLGIGLVISLYFVVVGASSAQFTSSFIEGLLMLILMIVITLFVILYYIQWMFCLKVVKLNSKTGADPGKMPGYVAFISIIAAALCGLLMVPMAPNDYIGLAARGSAAGYFLFMGLWVIIYKIKVKRN